MIQKEINKLIGNKLRKLRLTNDTTKKVIASIIGYEQSTYSRIKYGDISLSKDKAISIAQYYKIYINIIPPANENYNIENQKMLLEMYQKSK
jgi:transcriptional regulator with XRE-family HTH domain